MAYEETWFFHQRGKNMVLEQLLVELLVQLALAKEAAGDGVMWLVVAGKNLNDKIHLPFR